MNFNYEKYVQIILYILIKSYNRPHIGKTVLCTLLYFIDFNYYEIYGKLLTKETYIKSKKGIKPKHFNQVTQDLIDKKQLFLRREPYYNRTIHRYYPTIIPDLKIDEKELEIIELSIEKLADSNASEISQYTKYDPPLTIASFGEEIDCRYVLLRNRQYSIRKIKLKK